jgi:hypothetical protein
MDNQTILFIIVVIIMASIIAWTMLKGGKYIGMWMVYGAQGERLCVRRTPADARSDGKETMQFHLVWYLDIEGKQINGNDCITIIPTHWITRMDRLSEK